MTTDTFELVIARCDEDVQWLVRTNLWSYFDRITIYDKGSETPAHFRRDVPGLQCRRLPNVGREGHTYYSHVAAHYGALCTYTCFLQGEPSPHETDFIRKIHQFVTAPRPPEPVALFFPIGRRCLTNVRRPLDHPGLPLAHAFELLFRTPYTVAVAGAGAGAGAGAESGYIAFVAGAQFVASRTAIRSRTQAFYEHLVDFLSLSNDPIEGYVIERFHYPILMWSRFVGEGTAGSSAESPPFDFGETKRGGERINVPSSHIT
jgi:hypothetical protein